MQKIVSVSRVSRGIPDSLREEILQLVRSSNTAHAKKQDPCSDSRVEEFSRVVHREYPREDSEFSRENGQFREKIPESVRNCTDRELEK